LVRLLVLDRWGSNQASRLVVRWWRPHERPEDFEHVRHHHDVVHADLPVSQVVVRRLRAVYSLPSGRVTP